MMTDYKIPILKAQRIEELQSSFSKAYPFLKIEFFKNGHGRQTHSYKKDMLNPQTTFQDIRKDIIDGEFIISDSMTVGQLEKQVYEQFGLPMQVFRRSGNIWLETTMTDGWTLQQQNEHGKEISASIKRPSFPEESESGVE